MDEHMTKNSSKAFFCAVKENNHEMVKKYLEQFTANNKNFFRLKDKKGNSALHYAAKQGHVELFYLLLSSYESRWFKNFEELLSTLVNEEGKTPWHYAALFGHADFFKYPADVFKHLEAHQITNQNLFWQKLKNSWLNLPDKMGYTPLHLAVIYFKNDTQKKIKRKKQVCKVLTTFLELNINQQNIHGLTALHLATQAGCFATVKILLAINFHHTNDKIDLDVMDENAMTAHDLAIKNGNQRIDNLFFLTKKTKASKLKNNHQTLGLAALKMYARNVHLDDEEFFRRLKNAKLNEIEIQEIIPLRLAARQKKYRNKSLIVAIIASLCPAFFVSVITNFFPIPLVGTLLTASIFPLAYLSFVYVSYQARMREYNAVSAETIYFSWLANYLPVCLEKFNDKCSELLNASAVLIEKIKNAENVNQLENLTVECQVIQNKYQALQQRINKVITLQPDQKPKIKTIQLSRTELKQKKELGRIDEKKSSRWINKQESVMAYIGHTADILCPLSAGIEIAATIAAFITASFAFSFPPLIIALATVGGTLLLGGVLGAVLYKACYKKDQAEIGENNRRLVLAYDTCKASVNLSQTSEINNQLQKRLNCIPSLFATKREMLAHPPKPVKKAGIRLIKTYPNFEVEAPRVTFA